MILKMAWRNLWRNRRRTLITVASVFFGVLLSTYMTSMQEGSYTKMVEIVVKFYSGYIQIHHANYQENKSINNSLEYTDSLRSMVARQPEAFLFFPRMESFALASSEEKSKGCLLFGIDVRLEDEWTKLREKVTSGRYLEPGDSGVVIGQRLAGYMGLAVGDTLVLIGQGYQGASAAGMYPVVGIIRHRSPELDKMAVYMDIEMSRDFLSAPGKITSLVVNVREPGQMKTLLRKLRAEADSSMSVMSWEELQPEIIQQIESDRAGGMIMKGILYMVIAFGILGTMMMMVAERRREFGVMVAIGMQKLRLSRIILVETLLIGLLGTLAGMLSSFPVILYQVAHPIPLTGETAEIMDMFGFEPFLFFSAHSWIFSQQALTVFFITLIISLFPVTAILRLKVTRAMHS